MRSSNEARVKVSEPRDIHKIAQRARAMVVQTAALSGGGHIGGPLSAADILAVLYFHVMNVRPSEPTWEQRDRFVLSKGHSSLALYAILSLRGYFEPSEMSTFGAVDSRLQGHPDMTKLPGIDMSTGSLGLGFTAAVGMALGAQRRGSRERIYVMLGDGECQEGAVWEGAHIAQRYKLDNLCAVLDCNGLQQYGWPGASGSREAPWAGRMLEGVFEAFGWATKVVDGHDVEALEEAFAWAETTKGRPAVVIAKTVKGKGVKFMEGDFTWHSRVPTEGELAAALSELEGEAGGSEGA
ncbi:MAG: transketolase [Isosphaeraceae bacterium]